MGDSKSKLIALTEAAALAVVWCTGCTTPPPARTDSSLSASGLPATGLVGAQPPYYQVIIPSRGALADTIFVWQSAIFGPSRTADSVVRTMREAAAQDAVLLIRGESPQKTFRILYDALRLSRSGSMPREIIWVAPVGFTDKARRLHRRFGVRIRLAPPPS